MSRTRRVQVAHRDVQRRKVVGQRGARAPKPKLQPADLPRPPLDLQRLTYLTTLEAAEYVREADAAEFADPRRRRRAQVRFYMWVRRNHVIPCGTDGKLLFLRRDLDEVVQRRKDRAQPVRESHRVGT